MRLLTISACTLLFCIGCSTPPTNTRDLARNKNTQEAAIPAYAPVKRRYCTACPQPILIEQILHRPRHGLILSYGSILSSRAIWYIADIDRRKLSRIYTSRGKRPGEERVTVTTGPLQIDERVDIDLTDAQVSKLINLANRGWSDQAPLQTNFVMDVYWDLWLFDGEDIRRDSAAGQPKGLAQGLASYIEQLSRQGKR